MDDTVIIGASAAGLATAACLMVWSVVVLARSSADIGPGVSAAIAPGMGHHVGAAR